jgi:hypothetical protein
MRKDQKKDKVENSLLNLKQSELKDITLLDINYRMVISFSLLGDEVPILIRLKDIKYRDVRSDLQIRGSDVPIIATILFEEGSRLLVDTIFNYVEWEVFDILDDDYYKNLVYEIENKYTNNGIQNRLKIDKEIKELKDEVIYNLKSFILDKVLIDKELQQELMQIYNEIREVQNKIIEEFNDVLDNIMNFEDDKSINFTDYFTVMLKTGIVNSNVPLFEENIGKAFTDYSYREIKLRISFEHKETMLNANRMKVMLPVMARSMI